MKYILSKSTISNTIAKTRFNSISSKKDDHLSLHISLKDLRLISPATLRGPAIWSAKERQIGYKICVISFYFMIEYPTIYSYTEIKYRPP